MPLIGIGLALVALLSAFSIGGSSAPVRPSSTGTVTQPGPTSTGRGYVQPTPRPAATKSPTDTAGGMPGR
jgi:hypothetical protein